MGPVILMGLVAAIFLGYFNLYLVNRQEESLVQQRGSAVLYGISASLGERRRSVEDMAKLLADTPGLNALVTNEDAVGIAQVLVPLRLRLGLGRVGVYRSDGTLLMEFGPEGKMDFEQNLVTVARAGQYPTGVTASRNGLVVAAATAIKGDSRLVGSLVVADTLGGDALRGVNHQDGVQLAVYHDNRLVTSSLTETERTEALQATSADDDLVESLQKSLGSDFLVLHQSLDHQSALVVLVPTRDLTALVWRRSLMLGAAVVGGLGVLLLVLRLATNQITGAFAAMSATAGEMVNGNYSRRVPRNPIRELDDLGRVVNHLADQVESQMAQLSRQALRDTLTDLPNRALFLDRLGQALARADRRETTLAVLFLDLDNFKVVNDSLGHDSGDLLLVEAARRLQIAARSTDTAARLGGDEFLMLLEDVSGPADGIRAAERILAGLSHPFMIGQREVYVTASIGIALSTPYQDGADTLLRAADVAMYRAKARGRACYEVFDLSMNQRALDRLNLETDLHRALERNELRVYYQPIVDLGTGRVAEVEALVRWQHPARGLVSPGEFIPVAEETGLILPIGRWVLHEACRQVKVWQATHPGMQSLVVSVNLSPRQFQDELLLGWITRTLLETGLDAARLKLEITETAMMRDVDAVRRTLRELKELGIQLAVDDFGTGYSSLAHLKRFPLDVLKIDRSFVDRLGRTPEDTAIVRAIITLAKTLNLSVTGEGVETQEQMAYLRELGADLGQGYLYSKPVPAENLSVLLRGWTPVTGSRS